MPQAQILPKFLLCLIFGGMVCVSNTAQAQRSGEQGSDRGGPPSFGGPPPGFGGGPPSFGGGPPSPERMFGFMDRNQDGRVTEEEVPSFLRDRLRESGVDLRRGLNQEELGRAFDRARQERESSSGSTSSSDRGRSDSGSSDSERSRDDRNRSRGGSGPYVSSQKPRLTVDMPLSYADGDLDGDGQIGFYEWRKWRRNQTESFFVIDSNSDGFLTPSELNAAPTALAAASRAAATTAAPGAAPAATGSPPPGSVPASTGAPVRRGFPGNPPPRPQPAVPTVSAPAVTATTPPTGEQAEVLRRRGESMFRGLDRNRDGSIDADEWGRSRTLKPLFEQRGIDLTRPMSQQVFVDTYVQLNPN